MVYTVFYKTSSFAGYCFLSRYSIHPKRYGVFSFKVFIAVLVKIQICSFIDKNKLTDQGCKGAPDWIIEIVSPSSRSMDYNKKLFKYRTAGVREYWIVDPEKNRIMVYDFGHDTVAEYTFADSLKTGIYEDFEIDFSGINIE